MPMICAAFGIRASATRGVRARGERDERDAACFRVAKTRRRRPFARTTNDERRARRRISLKRNARVDGGENAKPSSTRSSREKKKTRLSCTVCEKASLDVAFAAVGRAGPHVAPSRGAGRAARPRASRRAVVAFARRRVGNLARGSSRRRPRLAAPIEGGAESHRASLRVGVGRDALSSAREQTRRRAVRANQTRARWMTHLVPRGPVPRAPLHHLQLVLDQSELLRTGRAFAGAGRG